MSGGDATVLGAPIERQAYDLSKDPDKVDNPPPALAHTHSDNRSPAALMRSMGFDPTTDMTPLQFLLAVINDKVDNVFTSEKRRATYKAKGGIALSYRLEAARTAAKFMHEEMPKRTINKVEDGSFADELTQATSRVTRKTMIVEEITRISPADPLAPAQYPPAFDPNNDIDQDIVSDMTGEEYFDEDILGYSDYDPDSE